MVNVHGGPIRRTNRTMSSFELMWVFATLFREATCPRSFRPQVSTQTISRACMANRCRSICHQLLTTPHLSPAHHNPHRVRCCIVYCLLAGKKRRYEQRTDLNAVSSLGPFAHRGLKCRVAKPDLKAVQCLDGSLP
jgi:hypothetical protein